VSPFNSFKEGLDLRQSVLSKRLVFCFKRAFELTPCMSKSDVKDLVFREKAGQWMLLQICATR
jgi:hypothetical protein